MSAPNPCGQPLRCRRCSTCATCSVLCRCRSFCTGKLFRRCSTCTTCSVLCRCRSYCPGTLFLSEQNCNMSNSSNIVDTEEVGRKGSVHSFLTIYYTSALVSSSPFPFLRGTRGRQGTQGTPGTQEDTREHRGNTVSYTHLTLPTSDLV